ncbi:MAG: alpha-ribazole transporter [Syntrophomonadaceae bacterium]|nr:alpha-ribazole transporter [Syntrophomonadaceae bacterium]
MKLFNMKTSNNSFFFTENSPGPMLIAQVAIFVALIVIGASLKLYGPLGAIALNSAAGYFSALAFGALPGGVIAALIHLFSATAAGFPLSLPIHGLISVQMGFFALSFGFLAKRINLLAAFIVTTLLNGVLAPLSLAPIFGINFFLTIVLPLLIGSAVNVGLAGLVYIAVLALGIFVSKKHRDSNG